MNYSVELSESIALHKFWVIALFFSIYFSQSGLAQTAVQPSGSGTEANPYQIASLDNLYWLTQSDTAWNKYYSLTTDIDASSTSSWDSGSGFTPIGNTTTEFTGTFNGNGNTISNLTINRSSTSYAGFFGKTEFAKIRELGLENITITASQYTGGLVGYAEETDISVSYSTGTIEGGSSSGGLIGFLETSTLDSSYSEVDIDGGSNSGGLVGYSTNSSSIDLSYATGTINGSTNAGGFVGTNTLSSITNCYSTGNVFGIARLGGFAARNNSSSSITNSYSSGFVSFSTDINNGGFIGDNSATVNNSYWNTLSSGMSSSSGGTGLSESEMKAQLSFSGWDFSSVWDIDEGNSYPVLKDNVQNPAPFYLSGNGTIFDPYLVSTWNDLLNLSLNSDLWGFYFEQTTDINASESSNLSSEGFSPIGDSVNTFTGEYNGAGYSIDNLFINRAQTNYIGMFGYTDGAKIYNLDIKDADITGNDRVGLLVGYAVSSELYGIFTRGEVTGNQRVGGLVGHNYFSSVIDTSASEATVTGEDLVGGLAGENASNSTISESFASGIVTGTEKIGGLVGTNFNNATIENSYASAEISGTTRVGGLVGENTSSSNIDKSYSYGEISGISETGGFVGRNSSSTIINSYWYSEFSSIENAIGFDNSAQTVGSKTFFEMVSQSTFTGWDFSNIWEIDEDISFPYLTNNKQVILPGSPLGNGLSSNPYQISNIYDLRWISANTIAQGGNTNIIQVADINAAVTMNWNSGEGFGPIGNLSNNFEGKYNGQGFSIDSLFINNTTKRNVGLFGYTSGAEIKNVNLINVDITGEEYIGGLVGYADDLTLIDSSHVHGKISLIQADGNIASRGGMVGHLVGSTVQNSSTNIDMNVASGNVGGLVGRSSSSPFSIISRSFSTGTVTSSNTASDIGGLVGENLGSISESYSTATVSGDFFVGGLVGNNELAGTISNSYSMGKVSANQSTVGGLTGINDGTITNSYSSSFVEGGELAGGLVGRNENDGTASNSYWNATYSDQGSSEAGSGKGSGDMKDQSEFNNWDFSTVWDIDEGRTFPFLRNNEQSPRPTDLQFNGTGTENDPFQIQNFYDMFLFGRNYKLFDNYFELRSDIDALETYGTRALKITQADGFSGNFDGKGHVISNYSSTRGSLFETLDGGTISNLGLENINIDGGFGKGGIVETAQNNAKLSNVYVTGTISGSTTLGGLVGTMANSIIEQSFAAVQINSSSSSGGLVGEFSPFSPASTITNSYWDADSSGQSTSVGGGTALTSAQMKQRSNYSGWDFATTWAIEDGNTYPFFQDNGSSDLEITGNEGWRILSSPVAGATFASILDTLWSQGITGADTENGTPNVYYWDESAQSFMPPSSMSETPGSGVGFLVYVYADDDNDGTDDAFPKKIPSLGSQFSGNKALNLSYTNSGSSENRGWNMVGNPYGTSINWDAGNGWTKSNMDNSIYVWSDSANAYLTWNGFTGTLGEGKIAAWQGFWVKANASGPALTFTDSVRSAGARHYKQKAIPQLKFTLDGAYGPSNSIVVFSKSASLGKDSYDAFKLAPLNSDFLSIATVFDTLAAMDIQALPSDFESIKMDISIEGSDLTDTLELSWDLAAIPENWGIELLDRYTQKKINIREISNLEFELYSKSKVSIPNREESLLPTKPIQLLSSKTKADSTGSRFALLISQNDLVNSEPEAEIPSRFSLSQNFPNPFNPSTNIQFALPEDSQVKLQVFDLLGRRVRTLISKSMKAGYHEIVFDASDLATGVYLYRIQAGNFLETKKMLLIK